MRQPRRAVVALALAVLGTGTLAACNSGDDVTVADGVPATGALETGDWAQESTKAAPTSAATSSSASTTTATPSSSKSAPKPATSTTTVSVRPSTPPVNTPGRPAPTVTQPAGSTTVTPPPAGNAPSESGGTNFAPRFPIETGPHATATINAWRSANGLGDLRLELIPDKKKCTKVAAGSLYTPNQWASQGFVQSRKDLVGHAGANAMHWDVLISKDAVSGATLTLYSCTA